MQGIVIAETGLGELALVHGLLEVGIRCKASIEVSVNLFHIAFTGE